ncbi:MAG: glycoside hydrolase family 15 protein [Leptospirales bacterium]
MRDPVPIKDYAIIGNGRSAALVSRIGSIDWLCWPRFDSPSIFGSILDTEGGSWSIAPTGDFSTERRYVGKTNVLETRFITKTGTLILTDLMPVDSEENKRDIFLADHEILRIVRCEKGVVEIEMLFDPKPNYGRDAVRMRPMGNLGIRTETSSGPLIFRTDFPYSFSGNPVRARQTLRAGETRMFSLALTAHEMAVIAPLGERVIESLEHSLDCWEDWAARMHYEGPGEEQVLRSALVLKLLIHAPSGAVVAAPTTSLPERIGSSLNWDYRFCWLRDASMTVRALFDLGYHEETEAFIGWLLRATRRNHPNLSIVYDIYGNRPLPERELIHWKGYRNSAPVRIGNAAYKQLQLDVYGEVIDSVALLTGLKGGLDQNTQRLLCEFGNFICSHWDRKDEGIWEPRSGRTHNTHSRVLCWAGLNRLLDLNTRGHLPNAPVALYERNRDLLQQQIRERAWNPELQSYVSHLDGDQVDASLLLMTRFGFEKASSDRMQKTYALILERLGTSNGLLYRYRNEESTGEGAFGICSFWGSQYMALSAAKIEEAESMFCRLLDYANDVGLFAEEIDPNTGSALGNFPQAFTHIGLINNAILLSRRRNEESSSSRQLPQPGSHA